MMKKPATTTHDLAPLITELREIIQSARHAVATTVNTLQVLTNFEIGRRIVLHEQKGEKRAEYGSELLKEQSVRLNEEFGKGFSKSNLAAMRSFYLAFSDRVQIFQKPSGKLIDPAIWQKPSAKVTLTIIGQMPTDQLAPTRIFQTPSEKSPFTLSWPHYVLLLTIKSPEERSFYEIEAFQSDWSFREQEVAYGAGNFLREDHF